MRLLKLLLILIVCAAGSAKAGPFEDGTAAYKRNDYAGALGLWRPLAEAGNARAQNKLGTMYYAGQGVPQDHATAMSWHRKAAEQGDAEGQFYLGGFYYLGEVVLRDNAVAASWYRKAAEQGHAEGQYHLGVMCAVGQGEPQDLVQAHMWFDLAGSRYDASEREDREIAVKSRDLIAAKMTPAQLAEAQRLAREWKPKTAR